MRSKGARPLESARLFLRASKRCASIREGASIRECASIRENTVRRLLKFDNLRSINVRQPMVLYCDNQVAVLLSANLIQNRRSKHIDLEHHFIRETVSGGLVKIQHIPTSEMIADILTKTLTPDKFIRNRAMLGLVGVEKEVPSKRGVRAHARTSFPVMYVYIGSEIHSDSSSSFGLV